MKSLLLSLVALAALTASAQLGKEYDIRPGASTSNAPTAVKWQDDTRTTLAAATTPTALAPFLANAKAADALLASVRPAYATDPIVATQIATLSQLVMKPGCPKADKARDLWTAALLRAAEGSDDSYRTLFFLDQLRWCGKPSQAAAIRALGEQARCKAVKQMAALAVRELEAAKL